MRMTKKQHVDILVKQYLRSDIEQTPWGCNSIDYTSGWRDAIRSVAVAAGLYSEFIEALEKADG